MGIQDDSQHLGFLANKSGSRYQVGILAAQQNLMNHRRITSIRIYQKTSTLMTAMTLFKVCILRTEN